MIKTCSSLEINLTEQQGSNPFGCIAPAVTVKTNLRMIIEPTL